jgi:hypothetical protein
MSTQDRYVAFEQVIEDIQRKIPSISLPSSEYPYLETSLKIYAWAFKIVDNDLKVSPSLLKNGDKELSIPPIVDETEMTNDERIQFLLEIWPRNVKTATRRIRYFSSVCNGSSDWIFPAIHDYNAIKSYLSVWKLPTMEENVKWFKKLYRKGFRPQGKKMLTESHNRVNIRMKDKIGGTDNTFPFMISNDYLIHEKSGVVIPFEQPLDTAQFVLKIQHIEELMYGPSYSSVTELSRMLPIPKIRLHLVTYNEYIHEILKTLGWGDIFGTNVHVDIDREDMINDIDIDHFAVVVDDRKFEVKSGNENNIKVVLAHRYRFGMDAKRLEEVAIILEKLGRKGCKEVDVFFDFDRTLSFVHVWKGIVENVFHYDIMSIMKDNLASEESIHLFDSIVGRDRDSDDGYNDNDTVLELVHNKEIMVAFMGGPKRLYFIEKFLRAITK